MTGASQDEVWPLIRDYHYSKRMPSAIRYSFCVRETGGLFGDTGELLAAAVFGQPVNRNWDKTAVELQRLVRTPNYTEPLSRLIAWSLKWLRGNTKIPFVLSYADTSKGHHGGIYQASGFLFAGERTESCPAFLLPCGTEKHSRQVNRELGTRSISAVAKLRPDWTPIQGEPKYLYIKPLRQKEKQLLKRLQLKRQPYPKPDHANCPLDEPLPSGVSREYPPEFAPVNKEFSCP
jgi:hypothetical protein